MSNHTEHVTWEVSARVGTETAAWRAEIVGTSVCLRRSQDGWVFGCSGDLQIEEVPLMARTDAEARIESLLLIAKRLRDRIADYSSTLGGGL